MQRQGRSSQETVVQPWGRVLAPPQEMHIAISLSCFADTEIPTRWDMLTACCPQARRPQTSRNQEVDHADFKLPPHHQKNIRELITPSSLNHSYKTSHYPFQVLTHIRGHQPTVALFAQQSNKALFFYFTPNFVSKTQFGDVVQRLNFRYSNSSLELVFLAGLTNLAQQFILMIFFRWTDTGTGGRLFHYFPGCVSLVHTISSLWASVSSSDKCSERQHHPLRFLCGLSELVQSA